MKKLLTILLATPLLISSCAEAPDYIERSVSIITSKGKINDKTVNQAIYDALVRKKLSYGLTVNYAETPSIDIDILSKAVLNEIDRKHEVLFLSGKYFGNESIFKQISMFPDRKYVFFDTDGYFSETGYKQFNAPFVTSVTYKMHEASYLAGYFAAKHYNNLSKKLTLGAYGGLQTANTIRYLAGIKSGIEDYVKDSGSTLGHTVIDLGMPSDHFVESLEQGKGKDKINELITAGANVIFPVAGEQTLDAIDIITTTHPTVKLIGVDYDHRYSFPEWEQLFITSVVKNIDNSAERILNDIYNTNGTRYFGKNFVAEMQNKEINIAYNDFILNEWYSEGMEVKARLNSKETDSQFEN